MNISEPGEHSGADLRPPTNTIGAVFSPGDSAVVGGADHGRVLVVEDEYLVAIHAETALRDAGFEVVGIAASAKEAVQLGEREAPDLVIMDIRIVGPGDGVDAAIELFGRRGVRCLVATAHDDPATRARAAAARPLGWIRKPYMMQELVRMSREAIERLRRPG